MPENPIVTVILNRPRKPRSLVLVLMLLDALPPLVFQWVSVTTKTEWVA